MSILQRPLSSGGYLARNGFRLADRHAAQAFHLPFAIALVAYGIAYVAWAAIRPFGSDDIRFIAVLDIAGALPPFLAAAMAFLAHQFSSGRTSRGWLLLALGWASWGVGEATWTVYEVVRRTDAPFPSLADVGYLAMVPLVLAGILTLTPGHPKSHRLTNLFNAASTTLLAAALTWYFVLGDIFGQADRRPEAFLSAAYPIGDLLLLTALALAFQRIWRGRAGIVLAVLFGGVVFFLVADIGFAYLDLNNEYESGNLITDPAWVISFLLMAYAAALHIAWQPNYRVLLDAGRRALWFQFLPVGYPVVLAIFLVAYALGFQSPVGGNSAMISFAAIASLTMLGRVMLVLVGNVRIVHETNRELSRAATMQSVLLPPRLHEGPHYDIAAHYLPARNLGGDFYDWWEDPPGTLHIALGDVMGKGMSAALLMASMRGALRASTQGHSVTAAVARAASAMQRDLDNTSAFVTLFYGQLDLATGTLTYVDCGHGLAFLVTREGVLTQLHVLHLPLGIFGGGIAPQSTTVQLSTGDALFVCSDGLLDLVPELLQPEALRELLGGNLPTSATVENIVTAGLDNGLPDDDLTALLLRVGTVTEASLAGEDAVTKPSPS